VKLKVASVNDMSSLSCFSNSFSCCASMGFGGST